jgi:uncharacterized protein YcbK (DUF882 family)
MTTQLTPHFSLEELNPLGLKVPKKVLANLKLVALELEIIRKAFGNRPISFTSGYRSRAVELEHGRDGLSRHVLGEAVDIVIQGLNAKTVQLGLATWPGGLGLANGFTHLDIRHLSTSRPTAKRYVRWRY